MGTKSAAILDISSCHWLLSSKTLSASVGIEGCRIGCGAHGAGQVQAIISSALLATSLPTSVIWCLFQGTLSALCDDVPDPHPGLKESSQDQSWRLEEPGEFCPRESSKASQVQNKLCSSGELLGDAQLLPFCPESYCW